MVINIGYLMIIVYGKSKFFYLYMTTSDVKKAGIIQLWKGSAPIVIFTREFIVHSRGNKLELFVVRFSGKKIGADSE